MEGRTEGGKGTGRKSEGGRGRGLEKEKGRWKRGTEWLRGRDRVRE